MFQKLDFFVFIACLIKLEICGKTYFKANAFNRFWCLFCISLLNNQKSICNLVSLMLKSEIYSAQLYSRTALYTEQLRIFLGGENYFLTPMILCFFLFLFFSFYKRAQWMLMLPWCLLHHLRVTCEYPNCTIIVDGGLGCNILFPFLWTSSKQSRQQHV